MIRVYEILKIIATGTSLEELLKVGTVSQLFYY